MMKKSIEVEDGIHMEISWSEAAARQALVGASRHLTDSRITNFAS